MYFLNTIELVNKSRAIIRGNSMDVLMSEDYTTYANHQHTGINRRLLTNYRKKKVTASLGVT